MLHAQSTRLTHVLGEHGGDGEGVHPLGLASAVLAVDCREAGGLDAAAEERVEVLAAGRDFDLLASGAGERSGKLEVKPPPLMKARKGFRKRCKLAALHLNASLN